MNSAGKKWGIAPESLATRHPCTASPQYENVRGFNQVTHGPGPALPSPSCLLQSLPVCTNSEKRMPEAECGHLCGSMRRPGHLKGLPQVVVVLCPVISPGSIFGQLQEEEICAQTQSNSRSGCISRGTTDTAGLLLSTCQAPPSACSIVRLFLSTAGCQGHMQGQTCCFSSCALMCTELAINRGDRSEHPFSSTQLLPGPALF